MVLTLNENKYENGDPEEFKEHFNGFGYSLSPFQKFAIEGIVGGHHSLSCVPTGSGKTLPALFAIRYFVGKGKRVIYTSPIKALSNQKYYEFTQKFPDMTIGLLTGDIKLNPGADVLIMTAEILQNTLHRKEQVATETTTPSALLSFDMDINTELGCVIHDEVHMINDADRGHVWENMILMLPKHIQMVMLSATLDNSSNFARWVETRGQENEEDTEQKQVYLACSTYRPVPLTHYMYLCSPQAIFKAEKDKVIQQKIRETLDTIHPVVSPTGVFDEVMYNKVNDTLKRLENHKVFVKRSFVLNEVCKYMVHNNMLPAVCFILSKKQIHVASKEISVPLLGEDDAVPAVVAHECDQLLRSKLPNHEEFKRLPEYIEMVELMSKGIAVHHSGILPILREMVELMFARGFIKLLFATETFSVGLDMPIKTALFTDIKKFDGTGRRMFLPHEYIQAAGRAGRRGRDKIGNVIHLPNLYRDMSRLEFRAMTTGGAQSLVSKFRISYGLVLNLLGANAEANTEGATRSTSFCSRSMIQYELDKQVTGINQKIATTQQEIIKKEECIKYLRTPLDTIYRFHELEKEIPSSKNKKRKTLERELATIKENKNIMSDAATVASLKDKQTELQDLNNQLIAAKTYLGNQVGCIIDLFKRDDYISSDGTLTLKGNYAANLREGPCLVFAEMLTSPEFASLEACDLAVLFSCFAGIRVAEDDREQYVSADEPADLKAVLKIAAETAAACADFENEERVYASRGDDSDIQFDLMSLVREWYAAEDEPACKLVVQRAQQEKGILLGEFTKAITKIVNIAAEVERVAEFAGDLAMVGRLRDVSKNLLKFVVTNQSLYV